MNFTVNYHFCDDYLRPRQLYFVCGIDNRQKLSFFSARVFCASSHCRNPRNSANTTHSSVELASLEYRSLVIAMVGNS